MTATTALRAAAAQLRAPFEQSQIGLLPKITCGACSKAPKRVCNEHLKSKCDVCGNYLTGRHIHIEYAGHGAVTDRLLQVDPEWNWDPCGEDHAGQPVFVFDREGHNPIGLWIKLTVLGVTRRGYGSCDADQFDAEKVLIGDALRNAAMRFGVGLDLWIKGQADDDEKLVATDERGSRRGSRPPADPPERRTISPAGAEKFTADCAAEGIDVAAVVREATGGRTDDPAEVLIEEMPKLRDARRKVADPEPDGQPDGGET